jgi:hypothetical protein
MKDHYIGVDTAPLEANVLVGAQMVNIEQEAAVVVVLEADATVYLSGFALLNDTGSRGLVALL